MKKHLLLIAAALTIGNSYAQVLNFNPALSATAYTWYTNDVEHMTTLQSVLNLCGPAYNVPSLHFSTTPVTNIAFNDGTAYVFEPGYNYTVQIQGSATATGNLSNPSVPIYFAVTLGPPQSTTNIYQALNPFPDPYPITSYAGSITVNGPLLDPRPTSTADMYGTFLTGILGVGSLPNSSTTSFSTTTPSFTTTSTTGVFNIEVYPTLGDQPAMNTGNGCGGVQNNVVDPTNTTLTINSITITKTPIVVPTINGGSYVFFSSSHTGDGGTITAAPGATVTVAVSAGGPPSGSYTTQCNLSGASFSTGGSSLTVTNNTVTATFVMPASGSISWTGNYSGSNSSGSGTISVN
jgi:hypothetical protein